MRSYGQILSKELTTECTNKPSVRLISHIYWDRFKYILLSPTHLFFFVVVAKPSAHITLSFGCVSVYYFTRCLFTHCSAYGQIFARALWLLSGHLPGQRSQECLQPLALASMRRASVGAWVSLLTDRLASTKVTFWQTFWDEMLLDLIFH